jgi:hypothetical protein
MYEGGFANDVKYIMNNLDTAKGVWRTKTERKSKVFGRREICWTPKAIKMWTTKMSPWEDQ